MSERSEAKRSEAKQASFGEDSSDESREIATDGYIHTELTPRNSFGSLVLLLFHYKNAPHFARCSFAAALSERAAEHELLNLQNVQVAEFVPISMETIQASIDEAEAEAEAEADANNLLSGGSSRVGMRTGVGVGVVVLGFII